MAFRLRQIDVTADGRQIVRDRDLSKRELTLGRAAESDIPLPDLAVEPQHARIAELGQGRIAITATGTLGFTLDGAVMREAVLDCRSGGELRFGSYRISASLAEDEAVLLTIERVADPAGEADDEAGFPLAATLPSKRLLAWLAVLLILGLFLALPIASHLSRGPDPKAGVVGDASWTPGKLSLAHHALEQRCERSLSRTIRRPSAVTSICRSRNAMAGAYQ